MAAKIIPDSIRDVLDYDPDTGEFTWRVGIGKRIKAGMVAGCRLPNGYIQIAYNRKRYMAHRIAWFLVHNEQPPMIDHADRNPGNNRLRNLRASDSSHNQLNRRGVKGVTWRKDYGRGGKPYWYANATYKNKSIYRGNNILIAHFRRIMAVREGHPIGLPSP